TKQGHWSPSASSVIQSVFAGLLLHHQPYKAGSLSHRKHTHSQHMKQHTVNTPSPQMLTPSCSVPLIQCQYFLLAPITVLVSLGMKVTPSQFPPQCQNARRSPAISC
ncbi:unnamed protein product, partial [Staurois parvus]